VLVHDSGERVAPVLDELPQLRGQRDGRGVEGILQHKERQRRVDERGAVHGLAVRRQGEAHVCGHTPDELLWRLRVGVRVSVRPNAGCGWKGPRPARELGVCTAAAPAPSSAATSLPYSNPD
jgi:hypothetical protein